MRFTASPGLSLPAREPDRNLHPEHAAVHHLQHAARSGRPVLLPGALEPQRDRPTVVLQPVRWEPHLDAISRVPAPRTEREHERAGAPAHGLRLLDRLQLVGLRGTEAIIRLLATPARFTGV